MSSFDLLELFGVSVAVDAEAEERIVKVEWPPEDGAVAMAMRAGDRPEWKRMLAQAANELSVIRVAYVPTADGDEYGAQLFLPVEHESEPRVPVDGSDSQLYSLWQVREEG